LSTTGKLFGKLNLRTIQRHWGEKIIKSKSVWFSSRTRNDTSVYEAGGSRHPKFQP
jgi:hypothetical protein